MELASKLHHLDLTGAFILDSRRLPRTLTHTHLSTKPNTINTNTNLVYPHRFFPSKKHNYTSRLSAVAAVDDTPVAEDDIESLFSEPSVKEKRGNKQSSNGASTVSSGVKLENIRKTYKGVTVLKEVNWEVKKGEKVGLVGVNGAGKTTQMRIIAGLEEPDSGNVIKAKQNMKIAFLSQEFEVSQSRTVREEFMSAFKEEMEVATKLEKVQKALESSVNDLDLMGRLLDEFDLLQRRAQSVNLDIVDSKISKLMPELGFGTEDSDRLVASFSGGWQMRMCLGKILLQVYYTTCCYSVVYFVQGYEKSAHTHTKYDTDTVALVLGTEHAMPLVESGGATYV